MTLTNLPRADMRALFLLHFSAHIAKLPAHQQELFAREVTNAGHALQAALEARGIIPPQVDRDIPNLL